jgi:hypothetical protein
LKEGGGLTVDAVEAVLVDQRAGGSGEAHAERTVPGNGCKGRAAGAAADGDEDLEMSAVGVFLQRRERAEAALRAVDLDLGVGILVGELESSAES